MKKYNIKGVKVLVIIKFRLQPWEERKQFHSVVYVFDRAMYQNHNYKQRNTCGEAVTQEKARFELQKEINGKLVYKGVMG